MSSEQVISGNIIDVTGGRIFPGQIRIGADGCIAEIRETPGVEYKSWISPGLVDAHVHIESSMVTPSEFGRIACRHGSVASVSDPHEIANVLGLAGVEWMIEDATHTPFKVFFGAPSCVPATPFETAGAVFGEREVDSLLARPDVKYLSEVMNFPAVIGRDPAMMAIVEAARRRGKHIDGHAPGVIGEALRTYAAAGIETDHECVTLEEGRQRCQLGMKVAIREGSAAKNFEALWPLFDEFPGQLFFCSDDKHPDDLVVGHINQLVARAIAHGVDSVDAFRAATCNPVKHYGLEVGLLRVGDPADLAEWESLESMRCLRCWINGAEVAENGSSNQAFHRVKPVNQFNTRLKADGDFALPACKMGGRRVIVAHDGQLITSEERVEDAMLDPERDLLKICVVNRYADAPPAVALIRGFGFKRGAIASSVAHDSHNIVAVGADDHALCRAVNLVIAAGGGLSAVAGPSGEVLPLPVAGLMSDGKAESVAAAYQKLSKMIKAQGCALHAPFMTLSFMALLVIPSLKLGDRGLFDVNTFSLVED